MHAVNRVHDYNHFGRSKRSTYADNTFAFGTHQQLGIILDTQIVTGTAVIGDESTNMEKLRLVLLTNLLVIFSTVSRKQSQLLLTGLKRLSVWVFLLPHKLLVTWYLYVNHNA